MTQPAKRPRKKQTLPFAACVSVGTNPEYFQVQIAIQNLGYLLIDLETGEIIDGQVSLSMVGIIDPRKPHPPARRLGFVQPVDSDSSSLSGSRVDAILSVQESQPGDPALFTVDVVDNAEVELWGTQAHQICQQFAVKIKRSLTPSVIIGVYGLCIPNEKNPQSARDAVLRRYQKYGFDEPPTVTGNYVLPQDYGYDE